MQPLFFLRRYLSCALDRALACSLGFYPLFSGRVIQKKAPSDPRPRTFWDPHTPVIIGVILGLYWGLYWGYIGIMENNMETTIMGYMGLYRDSGQESGNLAIHWKLHVGTFRVLGPKYHE